MDRDFISCSIFNILLAVRDALDVNKRWGPFLVKEALFIAFNRFIILHIGGKRSTIKFQFYSSEFVVIRKIFLCFLFFDKLLRFYRQCLGRERKGSVLHYRSKFSDSDWFAISIIQFSIYR